MRDETTCVHVAQGEFDAQWVRGFLEAHGIPCEFRGESLRLTHGLTLDGLGEVRVHVPADRVEEARSLLDDALSKKRRVGSGDGLLDPDAE